MKRHCGSIDTAACCIKMNKFTVKKCKKKNLLKPNQISLCKIYFFYSRAVPLLSTTVQRLRDQNSNLVRNNDESSNVQVFNVDITHIFFNVCPCQCPRFFAFSIFPFPFWIFSSLIFIHHFLTHHYCMLHNIFLDFSHI